MAVTYSFQDRFSFPQAEGASPSVTLAAAVDMTEQELELAAPDLKVMADMVRQYSVLLERVSLYRILIIITKQSDPWVATRLAAAKNRNTNTNLFTGLDAVRAAMFNDPERYENPAQAFVFNSTLFSDGIRRVSASLAAAILLAQLPEVQREYAAELRELAAADLKEIVDTYLLTVSTSSAESDKVGSKAPVAFYFQPLDFDVDEDSLLSVEWYCPSFTTQWLEVQTYTGAISTWHIVADLADAINQYTAQNIEASLLATADLGGVSDGTKSYHTLSFYPRRPINGVIGHSINVRITVRPNILGPKPPITFGEIQSGVADNGYELTPFKWGVTLSSLTNYPINGSIIAIYYNRSASLSQDKINEAYIPTVLYFRNKRTYTTEAPFPPQQANFTFRLQPWHPAIASKELQPEEITEVIERVYAVDGLETQQELDNSRYSQLAFSLMQKLATSNLQTKACGCLTRNDPLSLLNPLAGVELVAWATSAAVSHIVLDVLEIPPDIEIATGDLTGPRTSFSNRPRSIRMEVTKSSYYGDLNSLNAAANNAQPYIIPNKKFKPWQDILDENNSFQAQRRPGWYL